VGIIAIPLIVRAVRERSRKLGKWHARWYPPEGPSSGGSLEPLRLEIVQAIVGAPEARGASFCRFRRGRCGRDGFSWPKFSFCLYGLRGVRSYRRFRRARCTDGLSVLSATVATARRFPEDSAFLGWGTSQFGFPARAQLRERMRHPRKTPHHVLEQIHPLRRRVTACFVSSRIEFSVRTGRPQRMIATRLCSRRTSSEATNEIAK
jgi:hypothetical protein